LRIAIVGLGNVAEHHVAALEDFPDAVVVGGMDPDVRKTLTFRGVPVPRATTVPELFALGVVETAIVTTPTATHAAVVDEIARCSPCRILVEKPLATTAEDVRRLLAEDYPNEVTTLFHAAAAPEVEWAHAMFHDFVARHGPVVAIDGPAGSGKSTAARRLAQALGFTYLNTGAMYRAVAFVALESGIDLTDAGKAAQIGEVARAMQFEYLERGQQQRFIVNRQDRTEALFTAALTGQLKPVVNNPAVRSALVAKMREAAHAVIVHGARGVVLEGRDIGTVVFPDAPIKFYIHADLDARTKRRAAELEARGESVDFDGLRKQIQYRDETDKGREVGALKQAADAIDVDTTHLNEEATLQRLVQEVKAHHLS